MIFSECEKTNKDCAECEIDCYLSDDDKDLHEEFYVIPEKPLFLIIR
jgi:hypothetical protein